MGEYATDPSLLLRDWFQGATTPRLPRILLLDGGVSTHLEDKLRHDPVPIALTKCSTCPFPYRELWSSGLLLSDSGRERIKEGHMDWIQAGVNVLSTVTYQCHYEPSLWPSEIKEEEGVEQQPIVTIEIMNQMWSNGIALAKSAAAAAVRRSEDQNSVPPFVVASSGCYGAALANGAEYSGAYFWKDEDNSRNESSTMERLMDFHRSKLQVARALLPDGIAFETIPSLQECVALKFLLLESRKALDQVNARENERPIAFYVSLACRNGSELNDGTPVETALKVFRDVPIDCLQGIGFNCCDVTHLQDGLLTALVQEMVQHTPRRGIVVYPNSGELWDATHEQWVPGSGCVTATEMAQKLFECITSTENEWQVQGSNRGGSKLPSILIGGCCRTRPATISALRGLVDRHLEEWKDI